MYAIASTNTLAYAETYLALKMKKKKKKERKEKKARLHLRGSVAIVRELCWYSASSVKLTSRTVQMYAIAVLHETRLREVNAFSQYKCYAVK